VGVFNYDAMLSGGLMQRALGVICFVRVTGTIVAVLLCGDVCVRHVMIP
jgi:hypothetical protein